MNDKNRLIRKCVSALLDAVLVFLSYLFSAWFWIQIYKQGTNMATRSVLPWLWTGGMMLCMLIVGVYNRDLDVKHHGIVYLRLWASVALSVVLTGALLFLLHLDDFSRGVLFLSAGFSGLLVSLKIKLEHIIQRKMRQKGIGRKRVLVAGTGHLAQTYAENARAQVSSLYDIVGFMGQPIADKRYLGPLTQIDQTIEENNIDEVVIALRESEVDHLRQVIMACENTGVKVSVIPFYNELIPVTAEVECLGSSRLINLRSNPLDNIGKAAVKRAFDVVVSALLLVLLSPLLITVAVGIRLGSPGKVIFSQRRIGRNKKPFTMYKFRSMRTNAQQDTAWSGKEDNRRTRFGSLIRKCSIDELPQLWNVLRGDMSLVGPRPEIPHYVQQFRDSHPMYMVRHQVRPGMTGWAQVNGFRGDTSIAKRVEFDIWYIEHWSVRLDLAILVRTALGGFINNEKLSTQGGAQAAGEDRHS